MRKCSVGSLVKLGTPEDIMETTKMFTHCADLSGSCKEFAIASRWSVKVNEEFMEQVVYHFMSSIAKSKP